MGDYETILVELSDHIATVTLNRPERLNAFDQTMCDEFSRLWAWVRTTDDVHVVVLRAAGDRAFCSGVDQTDGGLPKESNPWSQLDPGRQLGPKANDVWKPVVCAVHGMCAGGAFYWINEADIVICSADATFFDPHLTYGMVSALEPMGLSRRIPYGEAMRWALLGLDERMSATRAHGIGLVSEVVHRDDLHGRAADIAGKIAAKPAAAVQGTVRAVWQGFELSPRQAQAIGYSFTQLGNPIARVGFRDVPRPQWELR
ncbi:enoyl-CoA hydratase/isomerase family protein [Cryptosporangium aurantiacum]|uniref:Enoyl-CoA hydratase/carnithine racemase n=1 Tax=Cryptosporangium aurantiacum TaxID=134849 RepID=A0A1M7R4T7_9ACTN|nr:enoyl-CoA hydratase/isomerase family protein [Cryptosporangium aurantiacum]SHN40097.1 Enoyl-CoA hydratase/carnithine racemase [Cryptosporangium aurantiacum]